MKAKHAKSAIRKPFVTGDPLTKLLKDRLHLNSVIATCVIVLILNVIVVVLAAINNALADQGNRIGLLHDYAWWIYQLFSVPATVLFFLWMPEGIESVLEGLRRNKTVLAPDRSDESKSFQEFIARFDGVYSHWIWATACIVALVPFMLIAIVPEHRAFQGWQTSGAWLFWYHEAFWYFMFILVAMIVVRVIICIYWFNRLFKEFRANVRVLHPDGAGGLSPLGSFSVKVGYLIGIFGIAELATIWSHSTYLLPGQPIVAQPVLLSFVVVYLVFAPIIFFSPIGSAHSAMRTAKDEFLLSIANQFEVDFTKIQEVIGKDSEELKARLEKIEHLQTIHKIASNFRVWPFNTTNVLRFFSSILSPVVLALISSFIGSIFK